MRAKGMALLSAPMTSNAPQIRGSRGAGRRLSAATPPRMRPPSPTRASATVSGPTLASANVTKKKALPKRSASPSSIAQSCAAMVFGIAASHVLPGDPWHAAGWSSIRRLRAGAAHGSHAASFAGWRACLPSGRPTRRDGDGHLQRLVRSEARNKRPRPQREGRDLYGTSEGPGADRRLAAHPAQARLRRGRPRRVPSGDRGQGPAAARGRLRADRGPTRAGRGFPFRRQLDREQRRVRALPRLPRSLPPSRRGEVLTLAFSFPEPRAELPKACFAIGLEVAGDPPCLHLAHEPPEGRAGPGAERERVARLQRKARRLPIGDSRQLAPSGGIRSFISGPGDQAAV